MSIELRWVGTDDLERVALTRLRCYAPAAKDLDRYRERLLNDPRGKAGDYVLAEVGGEAVGTATSLSLTMWVRGAAIPCQGVAWVGAIKTMRRRGGGEGSRGVASAVMTELLRKARERGDVVSALMPFRGSFYEHFGYGLVERRNDWTLPMTVLPTGAFDGIRFYEPGDFAARARCLREANRAGQCDPERSDEFWRSLAPQAAEGMEIIDRPAPDGPARGWMLLVQKHENGKDILRVVESFCQDLNALRRQLHFLASLRDQYSSVQITLAAELRLNWLLKESQLPHRPVNHPFAKAEPVTRMQLRVLDHKRFLQALHLPIEARGSANVIVRECDGAASQFHVEIDGGRAAVTGKASAELFDCPDRVWAAVASGDMPASEALRLGLASGSERAAGLLDVLNRGPAPFSHEYF